MLTMVVAFLFFMVSWICGVALLRRLKVELPPVIFVLTATVAGVTTVTLSLFFLAWMVPIGAVSVGVEMAVFLLAALWSLKTVKLLRSLTESAVVALWKSTRGLKLGMLFFVVLAVWLFGRSLFFDENGWLVAGDRLVWTDWPLHLGMAANFAWGGNFPPQNPTFAGIPLIYPFFADFLSGALLVLGVSVPLAFAVPGVVLTLAFFGIFIAVVTRLVSSDKLPKSLIGMEALFISLFWGGLGWVFWLKEAFVDEVTLVATLLSPPREYTFWGEKGLWFFTFLYSEILPQRAFLVGLPLFFLILLLVVTGWQRQKWHYLAIAGVSGGLLPFFHTHTYLSLLFLSITMAGIGGLGLLRRNKSESSYRKKYLKTLFLFFVPLGILSLIQLPLFLSQGPGIAVEFGWMKAGENFFLFWFKNTGLFIPLYLFGLWKGGLRRWGRLVGVAAWSLFVLPNLFRFAPWGYDNLKIFTYWYLIGSVCVAAALVWFWRKGVVCRAGAVLLFISLILSGVVEVTRIVDTPRKQIGLWSREDQEFAVEVRQKTEADAVFLTAAVHDHPVTALAGRRIILGFPGNSWSWGIKGWDTRERDVHAMYRGGEEAKSLWKKYGVDYIIVGDKERWFEKELDEGFIAQNSQLYLEKEKYKVYKVN